MENIPMPIQVTKYISIRPSDKRILQMVANDIPKLDIAKKMKISVRTVEASMFKVRTEFGLKKEAALIAELIRRKIIS